MIPSAQQEHKGQGQLSRQSSLSTNALTPSPPLTRLPSDGSRIDQPAVSLSTIFMAVQSKPITADVEVASERDEAIASLNKLQGNSKHMQQQHSKSPGFYTNVDSHPNSLSSMPHNALDRRPGLSTDPKS